MRFVLACAPFVATWVTTNVVAWLHTPSRRGALLRRWRDLRARRPARAPGPGFVDLSHRSAAYLLALRVGSLVRGVVYLAVVACVLFLASPLVAIPIILFLVWIYNFWQRAAAAAFFAATGDTFAAFDESALAYQFPSRRRGQFWNLGETGPALVLSTAGLALIMAASLPLIEGGDALITPIPGVYAQHSHLPTWAIGLVVFAFGALLAWSGALVDRATKRRAMRRETALPSARSRGPRVVFLRPFGVEELRLPAHQGPRRDGLGLLLPRRSEFLEDVVTWLFWSRGEVLAIAKPGSGRMRTVGAAHHPVQDGASWTAAVSNLLTASTAIVLIPGATPGVAWELDQIRQNGEFAKKALLVNPEPVVDGSSFLERVGAPARLAQELRGRRLLALAAVITPGGPKLLCSSLAEDVDMEAAVEWFLRNELPPQRQPSALRSLAAGVLDLVGKFGR